MRRRDPSETWLPTGERQAERQPDGQPAGGSDAETAPPPQAITPEADGRYADRRPGSIGGPPELLGQGGVGRVIARFDLHLGREVAVKELVGGSGQAASSGSGDLSTVDRFVREARITAQLEHPSIVPVYELGRRDDGSLYYVMRRVRGRTLEDALREAGDLEGRLRLLGHFVQLCQAMAYAHSRGVVHRDLKPRNVMVGEFGETVVLDWGLARARGEATLREREFVRSLNLVDAEDGRTHEGATMGTPAYMSPEQASGEVAAIDARSDVWSLGAVLFVFLTGRPPFVGAVDRGRGDAPASVLAIEPRAPPELAAIASRALRADPAERYPSAAELAREVEAWRGGRLVGAYLYSPWEVVRKWAARHRAAVVTASVAAMLLVGTAGGAFVRVRGERDRAVAAETDADAKAAQLGVQLARSFTDRAQSALRDGDAGSAWMLAARSLALTEDPEARGALLRARSGFVPRLTGIAAEDADCSRLAWRPDGAELACVAAATIRLFRGDGSPPVLEVPLPPLPTGAYAWSADGLRFAAGGEAIEAWDRASGKRLLSVPVRAERVWGVAFSPDGRLFAAHSDGVARAWDVDGGRVTAELRGHPALIRGLAVSPDGARLATAGNDTSVRLWDLATARELPALDHHGRGAFDVAWSPDGRTLATVGHVPGGDGRVRLWDTESGRELAAMEGHTGEITLAAFSPDGRILGTRAVDGTVRLWDVEERRPLARIRVDGVRMRGFAFAPGGGRLDVSGNDGKIRTFDISGPPAAGSTPELDIPLMSVAFTPDGDRFAAAGLDGTVTFWDATTMRARSRVTGTGSGGGLVRFVGDDGRFLTGGGRTLTVHDAAGVVLREEDGPTEWLHAALTDRAGTTAWLAWRWHPFVRLDLRTGERRILDGPYAPGPLLAAVDDPGKRLAIADSEGALTILDASTGATLARRDLPDVDYVAVRFNPSGATLAASRRDHTVDLLRAADLEPIGALVGHQDPVEALRFTPDGATFISGSWDQTVRIWDVATLTQLATLRGPRNRIWSLDVSPDGRRVVVGSADHRAWIFPLDGLHTRGDTALAEARAWLGVGE